MNKLEKLYVFRGITKCINGEWSWKVNQQTCQTVIKWFLRAKVITGNAISGNIGLAFIFGIVIILFPILFVFAKGVEESGLKKWISPEKLSEGEWLYHDIVVAGKKIKATWDGVSAEELRWIRKKYNKDVSSECNDSYPLSPSHIFKNFK